MMPGDPGRVELPVVSVCVCTYQRPQLLALLLDSLAEQSFSERIETIIVDNDPKGSASNTVERVKNQHPKLRIRYAVEPRKGIAYARNTAVSLAAGEFIAWIDDDETATDNWLEALWKTRSQADADAVFGPVVPFFPEGSPRWAKRSGLFDRPRHVTGTVIDVREARTGNALVKAGWFRTLVPPFDARFANTGGEDYNFFARIQSQGARFHWCDEAVVYEVVPFERQQPKWMLERRLRGSVNYWRVHPSSTVQKTVRALMGGSVFIVCGLAGIAAAPFGFHRAVRLWWRAMGGLGRVVSLTRLTWKGYCAMHALHFWEPDLLLLLCTVRQFDKGCAIQQPGSASTDHPYE
jgi:glycosyltransferase involved in cell wall biosynthesis